MRQFGLYKHNATVTQLFSEWRVSIETTNIVCGQFSVAKSYLISFQLGSKCIPFTQTVSVISHFHKIVTGGRTLVSILSCRILVNTHCLYLELDLLEMTSRQSLTKISASSPGAVLKFSY